MKKLTNKERCKKCIHKKVCEYQSYFINTEGIDRCNNYSPKVNKGYRKQEWISVDERLPEVGDDYLIVLKEKYEWEKEWRYHVDVATFTIKWDCIFNDWDEGQEIHITHWMPLPEPPKMKGGAE